MNNKLISIKYNNQTINSPQQEDILFIDYGEEDQNNYNYLNELTDEEYIDFVADFLKPTLIEWIFVGLFLILMIVGICGNCLVVYVVSRNKHMNIYLFIIFCLPPTVLNDITKTFWLSEGFCKSMLFVQNEGEIYVSVLTLVAISLERWKAISKPLKGSLFSKTTCQVIVFIWLFAAFLSLPEPFTLKTFSAEYARKNLNTKWGTRCKESWSSSFQQKYQLIQTLVLFIAPLLVISALCLHMNIVLRKKALQIGSRHLRERKRAMKMLIAVVLVFAISYMPVHLHNIATAFNFDHWGNNENDQQKQQQPSLVLIALRKFIPRVMSYSSSVINPITYNFMSEKFRKEFRRVCYCGGEEQRKESFYRKESMIINSFRRPSSFSPIQKHLPLTRKCTAISQTSDAQII
ncbi:G_PROTEIN_RECEP_F1_2 domain-containing protein [Meloidogyne graminicola]|uniref:G_PROTEIN_RECEP_F1_2 domain-containing protein n=1 Tax=Meloidogyne graminicola TaxID=189291 RepID=A0A8S9ZV00_9BILA|nr:G_PROTEIN_RECEP_F1_2 domain-containing protein [Meloidogyne graminicola]